MKIARFTRFIVPTLLALVCAVAAEAAPWRSLGPKRQVHTLVITGNYKTPRLLAELIQNESRQPYVLLPAAESGDGRIYFCPPNNKRNIEIRERDLNSFVRTAGPRRIIILGDERFVPVRYVEMLDGQIPIVRITGASWQRIADELTFMLNLSHLDGDFRELYEKMYGDIYRPISRPAPKPKQEAQQDKNAPAADAPTADAPTAEAPATDATAAQVPPAADAPAAAK